MHSIAADSRRRSGISQNPGTVLTLCEALAMPLTLCAAPAGLSVACMSSKSHADRNHPRRVSRTHDLDCFVSQGVDIFYPLSLAWRPMHAGLHCHLCIHRRNTAGRRRSTVRIPACCCPTRPPCIGIRGCERASCPSRTSNAAFWQLHDCTPACCPVSPRALSMNLGSPAVALDHLSAASRSDAKAPRKSTLGRQLPVLAGGVAGLEAACSP